MCDIVFEATQASQYNKRTQTIINTATGGRKGVNHDNYNNYIRL